MEIRKEIQMKNESKKLLWVVVGLALTILVIAGTTLFLEKHQQAEPDKLKGESEIKFETVVDKNKELIGYWQGVCQEAPFLYMIFTDQDYKILKQADTDVNSYPVFEKGTWSIDGDSIILTADTVVDGVAAKVPKTYPIKIETSKDQEKNFTVLEIGDNPAYFYGMKVENQIELNAIDQSQVQSD